MPWSGAEVEHVAGVRLGTLHTGHDENKSRNPHDKFVKGGGIVGPSSALSPGPESDLDSANNVSFAGEGLENDTQPVGLFELPVVLEQTHIPLLEVLVPLCILESLVGNHVWQTDYFPSIPPLFQQILLVFIDGHVVVLGSLKVGGTLNIGGSAQEQLVNSKGDDLLLGHASDTNWPVVDDTGHPGEGGT